MVITAEAVKPRGQPEVHGGEVRPAVLDEGPADLATKAPPHQVQADVRPSSADGPFGARGSPPSRADDGAGAVICLRGDRQLRHFAGPVVATAASIDSHWATGPLTVEGGVC